MELSETQRQIRATARLKAAGEEYAREASVAIQIHEGTSEIQRLVISRALNGLDL